MLHVIGIFLLLTNKESFAHKAAVVAYNIVLSLLI